MVSAEAPVLGQHRQEMTAVRLSGHICPAALLHPPPAPRALGKPVLVSELPELSISTSGSLPGGQTPFMHGAFIRLLIDLISFSSTEGETKGDHPLSGPGGDDCGRGAERPPPID